MRGDGALWYSVVKSIHVACVMASGVGFFVRGVLMVRGSAWLHSRWARILPDTVDGALLLSAVILTMLIRQYPFVDHWLSAKVLGLLAYIVIGSVALRRGRTRGIRVVAWLMATLVFGYIISVAVSKNSQGFLGFL